MLSEGKTTIDNTFMLKEGMLQPSRTIKFVSNILTGVLTMHLDKESYERAGLVGKPHGAKGNRGLKPRWSALPMNCYLAHLSNINLRQLSHMISGVRPCCMAKEGLTG